ncbi:MAG: hypothetical protein HN742_42635 [Lentisphaerae bacterium]|jgi:hypothetical protein|nr:hypothetical protein [Lentisphaerota bacterium]MBT4823050.1 hypothetical protein [Lentisphaerota bacterium]MBT5607888.1 hypothetical protein [Lentisphaerota bacterium]MBT7062059.1 hypothetical protein [Lentisphaerota bacterium]MBT7848636.1 hypothetical protein [Lentisphaerota bacterium]
MFCRALLAAVLTATTVSRASSPGSSQDAMRRIREFVPPLSNPLGDRLPILTWQGRGFPAAIAENKVEEYHGDFIARGFVPLANGCNNAAAVERHLPVFRFWQERGIPVCILPQSWMQIPFIVDRKGRFRGAHRPPASQDHAYPCPAIMEDPRHLAGHHRHIADTCRALANNHVALHFLCIDFEAGAYLRNTHDRDASVREQAAAATTCPRCLEAYGKEALGSPEAYAQVVDKARAATVRTTLADPLRSLFPKAHLGNFYAWPINRVPKPEGRWPAYGFENSGMNVAMPRLYMNAGWGGAGKSQETMNWNALYCCLEAFSPAASVLKEGEMLIPWVHVWLGGRYLDFVTKRGRKLPEPWAMGEVACHMMLRGSETFAIWMDAQIGEFPEDYPYPEYAAMGQFVYDLKGVQAGFNEMLAFNGFLRAARPMTYEVRGERGAIGPETATWSGMQTDHRALVRTVLFNQGKSEERTINAFGKSVRLTFAPRGRMYWVHSDGRSETIR